LISSASFDPPVLSISIGGAAHKFVLKPKGVKDQNELPTAIRERVTNAIIAQNTIEYQDSLKVRISARRNFLGEIRYVISADQGIDTTDLEFKAWAQDQLKEFKEAFGV
jgi:anti-sigma regulatory factor (Ser/Thr protein kinase)